MVHSSVLRRLVFLVLALILTASPTWAAFPVWDSLAGKLLAVFPWLSGSSSRLIEKSGCTIDPLGQSHCQEAAVFPIITQRSGCTIDPNGQPRCVPGAVGVPIGTPKSGRGIDPDGAPHCSP